MLGPKHVRYGYLDIVVELQTLLNPNLIDHSKDSCETQDRIGGLAGLCEDFFVSKDSHLALGFRVYPKGLCTQ